jgi:hypothetical protein
MTDPERAEGTSTAARSTHIVVIGTISPADIAARLSPALARVDSTTAGMQCLVLVPTATDVTDLAHELNVHLAPRAIRVAPLATPKLARRVSAVADSQVVVTTPAGAVALLSASAIKLGELAGVGICMADDLERDESTLDQALAEVSKTATKVVTASVMTPFVEKLLERYLHGARRVNAVADVVPVTLQKVELVAASSAAPLAALADVLEAADAPSIAILPADARREAVAREALARLGYAADSKLARVVCDGEAAGASLLILAGAPSATAIAAACAQVPSRVVAFVTARERAALAVMLPGTKMVAFSLTGSLVDAQAAEGQMRDRVRAILADGIPAREMLALEPLVSDIDPFVIAGVLLRMYERERDAYRKLRDARTEADARPPRAPAAERAPRASSGDRERAPRRDEGDRPPRREFGDRPPRKDFGDRPPRKDFGDRPPRKSFGDRPARSFDRGDRPAPRGDRPPPRGDRPRPAYGDRPRSGDDRGPRKGPPRGDRPFRKGPDR